MNATQKNIEQVFSIDLNDLEDGFRLPDPSFMSEISLYFESFDLRKNLHGVSTMKQRLEAFDFNVPRTRRVRENAPVDFNQNQSPVPRDEFGDLPQGELSQILTHFENREGTATDEGNLKLSTDPIWRWLADQA